MKYRTALLMAGEDVQGAGTKVIDIDVQSPISRIDIKFKATRGTGSQNMVAGIPAFLPKIEIVDGAKVLYSANGYLNQALGYYNRPGVQLEQGQSIPSQTEEGHFPIDFGRELWDEQLAFDPKRFTNPQLRITHSELAVCADASSNEMEVLAHIFDEKVISPIGFLAAMLHHDYTCGGGDSYEPISLPDDRLIRQILVRAFKQGYEPWYTIDEARLDENTLGNIVFDYTNLENYFEMMKSVWHPIQIGHVWMLQISGATKYVPQTEYWVTIAGNPSYSGVWETPEISTMKGGKILAYLNSTREAYLISRGFLPWHCFQFPMGKPNDLDDWYDPLGKKPRLRLRTGTTGGIGQVLLEELIRY